MAFVPYCLGRSADTGGAGGKAEMKLLNRIRGRGRYHASRGDHWFLLAVIGSGIVTLALVLLY